MRGRCIHRSRSGTNRRCKCRRPFGQLLLVVVYDDANKQLGAAMTEAKDTSKPILANAFIRAERQSHSAIVFHAIAILEYDLERCLKRSFRELNADMQKRLFGAYGPVGTFAAKIDMAYALGITTDEVHAELDKFRKIRNVFAHKRGPLSLDTEPVKELFYKFKRPPGITGSYLEQFVKCMTIIDDHLERYLVSKGETEDLRALQPAELIEKSQEKEPHPTEPSA